jgi:hypothetical protein
MILTEASELGHTVHVTSYCTFLRTFIDLKAVDRFEAQFNYVLDVTSEFIRKNCKIPTPGTPAFVVNQIIRYIDCYMAEYRPNVHDDDEIEIPKDIEDKLVNALVYATIWGIGGIIEESTRRKFDAYFQDMIKNEDVVAKYNIDMTGKEYETKELKTKISGDFESLFDLYYDMEDMRWVNWLTTVPTYTVNKDLTYL